MCQEELQKTHQPCMQNIFNFLSLIIDKENKKITFNWEDEIVNSVVLTNEGKMRLEQFN